MEEAQTRDSTEIPSPEKSSISKKEKKRDKKEKKRAKREKEREEFLSLDFLKNIPNDDDELQHTQESDHKKEKS